LAEGLQSTEPARRSDAALFLYRCGLTPELPTSLLLDLLAQENGWTRVMAAKALWDRQQHEEAIPTLIAMVEDNELNSWVRTQSARVLGQIGEPAKAAAPALRKAAQSKDQRLATAAIAALKEVEQ
jgi:predicted Zn-dependent protease